MKQIWGPMRAIDTLPIKIHAFEVPHNLFNSSHFLTSSVMDSIDMIEFPWVIMGLSNKLKRWKIIIEVKALLGWWLLKFMWDNAERSCWYEPSSTVFYNYGPSSLSNQILISQIDCRSSNETPCLIDFLWTTSVYVDGRLLCYCVLVWLRRESVNTRIFIYYSTDFHVRYRSVYFALTTVYPHSFHSWIVCTLNMHECNVPVKVYLLAVLDWLKKDFRRKTQRDDLFGRLFEWD